MYLTYNKSATTKDVTHLEKIANYGSERTIIHYISNGVLNYPMDVAIRRGKLQIAKYLEVDSDITSRQLLEIAIEHNQLEIVKYFLEKCPRANCIDLAAGYGHLQLVSLFFKKGHSCTTNAMDLAAGYGHGEVVGYLHARGVRGTHKAIEHANRKGFKEIVRFLIYHKYPGYSNVDYKIHRVIDKKIHVNCDHINLI